MKPSSNLCKCMKRLYTNCQIIQFETVCLLCLVQLYKTPTSKVRTKHSAFRVVCVFYASRITFVLWKDCRPARWLCVYVYLVGCRTTHLIMQSGLNFYSTIKTCWRLYWPYIFEILHRLTLGEDRDFLNKCLRNEKYDFITCINSFLSDCASVKKIK